MIKLMYMLSSLVTVVVLIGVAMFGNYQGWAPVLFMSMIFVVAIVMTVLMTVVTILLQRWQKEREQNDDKK